jgi:hypothetical protein
MDLRSLLASRAFVPEYWAFVPEYPTSSLTSKDHSITCGGLTLKAFPERHHAHDHYDHLMIEENMPFGRELVIRGAMEQLAPILMTALTAGLEPVAVGVKSKQARS